MQVRLILGGVLVCSSLTFAMDVRAEPQAASAAPRVVSITVGDPVGEKMEYSRSKILAKPAERLKIVLISIGTLPKAAMAHNFVLLTLGSDPKKFSDVAANARATDFIPPTLKSKVIASTGLVGPGERAEVTFTAPKAPGTYPFLCSFAGHFAAGMKGELIVK